MSGPRPFRPWRLGILVVDNDPIPELEIRPRLDEQTSVTAVRFHLGRDTGQVYLGEESDHHVPVALRQGLVQLHRIGVDAVGLCFTSSSVFAPESFDEAFLAQAQRVNPEWFVTTAALSIVEELRASLSRRPFALIPPWFSDETIQAVGKYLDHHEIELAGFGRYDLGPDWESIPRQDRFDRGAGWQVDPGKLVEQALAFDLGAADSVVVPGSGFRSFDAAGEIVRRTGLPVISANSAVSRRLTGARVPAAPAH